MDPADGPELLAQGVLRGGSPAGYRKLSAGAGERIAALRREHPPCSAWTTSRRACSRRTGPTPGSIRSSQHSGAITGSRRCRAGRITRSTRERSSVQSLCGEPCSPAGIRARPQRTSTAAHAAGRKEPGVDPCGMSAVLPDRVVQKAPEASADTTGISCDESSPEVEHGLAKVPIDGPRQQYRNEGGQEGR